MLRSIITGTLCGIMTVSASAGTLAQFHTILGTIDVELFDEDKPVTVKNFIKLVKTNAYTNMFLHRCDPGFVVQGGGFRTADPNSHSLFSQYQSVQHFGEILNEYSVGRRFSNEYGTIAMARSSGVNSATSQWFFNLTNNAFLDNVNGGFTVFGVVVRGHEVLEKFNTFEYGAGVVDMRTWYGASATVFAELPVNYIGNVRPFYDDLFYVNITLLDLQVKLVVGGRELSWNSVSNKLQHLEYTPTLNGGAMSWQPLISTNGNGTRQTFVDRTGRISTRYYRLRVNY